MMSARIEFWYRRNSFHGWGATLVPSGRRLIDVEDAVAWAFRSELPKRGAAESNGRSPLYSLQQLGCLIDQGNREPRLPAALGDPHPDALAIEQAVRALARFSGWSIDGVDLAPDVGLEVDQPKALARAVRGMSGAVVVHGRMGNRPRWGRPEFACGPDIAANGKPRVQVTVTEIHEGAFGPVAETFTEPARATRGGRYPEGAYSPLAWRPAPQSIADERADYLAWWCALDQLARDLADRLATLAVLPPSAPAQPWAGERDAGKPPALFRPADPVYRPQRRAAAEAQRARGERRRVAPTSAARAPRTAPGRGRRATG